MLSSIVGLVDYLSSYCSEAVRDCVIEAIQDKLIHFDEMEFSAGEIDKFILLSILFEYDDGFIKREYDPCCNFELLFNFKKEEN